ncbi:MAG: biotin/lipoyl-binding protein, partial [Planctomycetes bacterium]|nr:biotin/lipoyl-binding protein [Planctomycetota bacterium]
MQELRKIRIVFLSLGFLIVLAWLGFLFFGTIADSIEAEGRVTVQQSHPVTTRVSGIIKMVWMKEGDFVSEGDMIAELDSEEYDHLYKAAVLEEERLGRELLQVESEISALESRLVLQQSLAEAKRDQATTTMDFELAAFNRKKQLFDEGNASKSSYDECLASYSSARDRKNIVTIEGDLDIKGLKEALARKKMEHDRTDLLRQQTHLQRIKL